MLFWSEKSVKYIIIQPVTRQLFTLIQFCYNDVNNHQNCCEKSAPRLPGPGSLGFRGAEQGRNALWKISGPATWADPFALFRQFYLNQFTAAPVCLWDNWSSRYSPKTGETTINLLLGWESLWFWFYVNKTKSLADFCEKQKINWWCQKTTISAQDAAAPPYSFFTHLGGANSLLHFPSWERRDHRLRHCQKFHSWKRVGDSALVTYSPTFGPCDLQISNAPLHVQLTVPVTYRLQTRTLHLLLFLSPSSCTSWALPPCWPGWEEEERTSVANTGRGSWSWRSWAAWPRPETHRISFQWLSMSFCRVTVSSCVALEAGALRELVSSPLRNTHSLWPR